jgi:hypothetical protein
MAATQFSIHIGHIAPNMDAAYPPCTMGLYQNRRTGFNQKWAPPTRRTSSTPATGRRRLVDQGDRASQSTPARPGRHKLGRAPPGRHRPRPTPAPGPGTTRTAQLRGNTRAGHGPTNQAHQLDASDRTPAVSPLVFHTFFIPPKKKAPSVSAKGLISLGFFGASGWDRTSNPCLRRAVLYPLSYGRSADNSNRHQRASPPRLSTQDL